MGIILHLGKSCSKNLKYIHVQEFSNWILEQPHKAKCQVSKGMKPCRQIKNSAIRTYVISIKSLGFNIYKLYKCMEPEIWFCIIWNCNYYDDITV